MYRVDPPPEYSRKRAYSECYDIPQEGTPRILSASDTDLSKFDREKSFETAEAFRQTTGLLAKVVNALATVKPPAEEDTTIGSMGMFGGYHGFSDSHILSSELSYGPPQPRQRARSDFYGVGVVNPGFSGGDEWQIRRPTIGAHNEWTWSGDNNQIQQAINKRYRQRDRDRSRASIGFPPEFIVHVEEDDDDGNVANGKAAELKKPYASGKKMSIPDGLRKLFPFNRKRSSPAAMGLDGSKRKFSIMSVPENGDVRSPFDNVYSTVTANASPGFLQTMANGKKSSQALNGKGVQNSSIFPSDVSITSRRSNGSAMGSNTLLDAEVGAISPSGYQRNIRKRRESGMFAPNPLRARRGSLFPASQAMLNTQRRGSMFAPAERRGSTASSVGIMPPPPAYRRGSLFAPALGAAGERRPSILEANAEADLNVLENTTLADLIRALEVMHTQAVFEEASSTPATASNYYKDKKKQRKLTNPSMDVPPILSLFGGDSNKTLTTAAANRLYARRATVVGPLPTTSFNASNANSSANMGNILTRRRQSNAALALATNDNNSGSTSSIGNSNASNASKFKRRFSVRPTALAIPPGKAPPVGSKVSSLIVTNENVGSSLPSPPQTSLQRRLSLRPSPLAREPSVTSPTSEQQPSTSPISPLASPTSSISSTTRLLPPPGSVAGIGGVAGPRPSNPTSSTHSPLSRIVQISQAQRKSSMPETLDRNKKSDGSK